MSKVDIFRYGSDPLDPNATPLVSQAIEIQNPDGSFAYQWRDEANYVSQNPNAYANFGHAPAINVYEKFAKDGMMITSWTRPQDKPFSYLIRHLPNS